MATLSQLVYDNEIHFHDNRDYYAIDKFSGDSGIQGNNGPALEDAHYNVKHAFVKSNVEYVMDYEMTFERRYETQDKYYPIIMTTIVTDESNPYSFGNLRQVGEKNQDYYGWWGPDGYYGNANYGLNDYWGKMKINSSDGYFDSATYELSQGNEGAVNTKIGFDAIAKEDTVNPQYTTTIGYYLINDLRLPPYLTGPSRVGNREYWDIFYVDYTPLYHESTPRIDEIDTNIPVLIFDNTYYSQHSVQINQRVLAYTTDGDLTRFSEYISDGYAVFANNYIAPSVTEDTKHYNMYSDVYRGYWDVDEPTNETFVEYRYLEVWVAPSLTQQTDARVSLYKDRTGNELRAKIKVYGEIKQYRYSTDGGNSWTTVTAETASQTLTLPWEYMFYKRTDELRWLVYDKNHGGNMLLFDSEALCDDGSPWLASDYNEKNFYYPTTNSTGDPELSTLMGTTGMKSGFSTKYVLTYSDIVQLANELFDSNGMIEDLKKGIEMLGSNPIDAIQGLMYFPFDLANFFDLGTSQSIIIGGYTLQTANGKFMTSYNGYFEIGSISIVPSFPGEDYRNYEPYCNLNIFLPFIGLQSLKMNKYVGKIMSIRYYLDATNGACMACLFADGLLTDYFTGQVGVSLPITLTDYASYAGAAMQSLVGMAEGGANSLLAVPQGNVSGAIEGLSQYETSLFNLSQQSINNFKTTKGTSSSLMNHFLPNYVYVIFEIIETDETSNLATLQGRRSNASGTLNSFSGFLQTEWVNLSCGIATEEEKDEIQKYLASGIYI